MPRIVGIDVARGLAVLGMITAHVGPDDHGPVPPGGFSQLADGRSAALFVVLAGVSLALLSGGTEPVTGTRAVQSRLRILVRAVLIYALGHVLILLGTPVAVILPTYGVLFAVGVAVLRAPRAGLLAGAAAVALVGPLLRHPYQGDPPDELVDLLLGRFYPAAVWFAYVLVGLALGRTDLRPARTRWRLAGLGLAGVLVGHVGAWLARQAGAAQWWATAEPHSSTTFELVGNVGVAVLVLVACLALADSWPRAVAPVAAVGALALSAYTLQVVAIAWLGPDVVRQPRVGTWLAFLGVTILACWAWRATVGRGPFELLLHGLSTRAANVEPDRLPDPARPT